MDHYRPHRKPKFEGYYTRFHLPSGASLVLVMCSVPNAPHRRANVALAYVPARDGAAWRIELWPDSITSNRLTTSKDDFELVATFQSPISSQQLKPELQKCRMAVTGSTVSYELITSEIHFTAAASNHKPWSAKGNPEGWLVHLPLPLHWHVLSVASTTTASIRLPPAANLDPRDARPNLQCTAHLEKNWATSFPSAHIWVQAHHSPAQASAPIATNPQHTTTTATSVPPSNETTSSSICFAGGKILGTQAFLISYRTSSSTHPTSLTLRPPWTLALPLPRLLSGAKLAPFTSCDIVWPTDTASSDDRAITLTATHPLRGWRLEVNVRAAAGPRAGFFTLSAPHPGGFRDAWMAQSMRGSVGVRVLRRARRVCGVGVGRWEVVGEETFDGAGVEFGGEYFPLRGRELG